MGSIMIFTPGEAEPARHERDTAPTLQELRGLIGGYVEMPARWFDGHPRVETQVILNEDGMRLRLPLNDYATLWLVQTCQARGLPVPNIMGALRGTVVVLTGSACID